MIENWKILFNATSAETFGGSEEGIKYLLTLINQYKMLFTEVEALPSIETRTLRALYAYLIPYGWQLCSSLLYCSTMVSAATTVMATTTTCIRAITTKPLPVFMARITSYSIP
jgi:hypothetical protein